ncbi:respiratory nitrate reductase subunit gamma, partial [Streptomyces sp. SID10244]|nr:respiratory nitrate reductase subunit gamma [Streptomyces sp. SID10244]
VVIIGHAMGLVIPESWTDAIGVSEDMYHVTAALFGLIAGIATLGGLSILIYRRRRSGPVFMATTTNDKVMYVVLTAALVLGLFITLIGTVPGAEGVN